MINLYISADLGSLEQKIMPELVTWSTYYSEIQVMISQSSALSN